MLEPPGIPSCSECGYDLSQLPDADAGDINRTFRITVPLRTESLSPGEIQSELQNIDAYEFEQFVADLWEYLGWQTKVRQASGDAGVDVIATKDHPYSQKSVIQAKRYSDSTKVGGPEIQQYASLRQQVANVDTVVIVTTSSFTSSARSRADDLNVKLINGRKIVEILEDADGYEIANEYIDSKKWIKKKVPSQKPSTKTDTEEEIQHEDQTAPVRASSSAQAAGEKNTQPDSSESDPQTGSTESQSHSVDISITDFPFWYLVSIPIGAYGYGIVLGGSDSGILIILLATSIMYLDMLYAGISEDAKWKWAIGFILAYGFVAPIYLFIRLLRFFDGQ